VLALPLPGRLRSEVAPLLAVMRQVNAQLAYSDDRIEALTGTDARVHRLRSVPHVGPVTAAAFVAALDDAQRFRRAHEVEAYLGLVLTITRKRGIRDRLTPRSVAQGGELR
jgi:transposase